PILTNRCSNCRHSTIHCVLKFRHGINHLLKHFFEHTFNIVKVASKNLLTNLSKFTLIIGKVIVILIPIFTLLVNAITLSFMTLSFGLFLFRDFLLLIFKHLIECFFAKLNFTVVTLLRNSFINLGDLLLKVSALCLSFKAIVQFQKVKLICKLTAIFLKLINFLIVITLRFFTVNLIELSLDNFIKGIKFLLVVIHDFLMSLILCIHFLVNSSHMGFLTLLDDLLIGLD